MSFSEEERAARGGEFKRVIRAAAALHDIYNDKDLAAAVGTSRNTVGSWWSGAVPEPDTLDRLAAATGLDRRELSDYVHYAGPVPTMPSPGSPLDEAAREGLRRGLQPRDPQAGGPHPPSPR
jgi:transcriptional regulator with XRE-family HTH domain